MSQNHRPCRFYSRPGGCWKGSHCPFLHAIPSTSSTRLIAPHGSNISSSEIHHHLKRYLSDSFRFRTSNEIYSFVKLLRDATSGENWAMEEGQILLLTLATPGSNGLLRIGDIIRDLRMASDAGISPSLVSFQRAYLPLLKYFVSDSVVKSTIHHKVNSLYSVIHNNFDAFSSTVIRCMDDIIIRRSFYDPKLPQDHTSNSDLDGKHIFGALATILFEYLTRFRNAVAASPNIAAFTQKLNEWFKSWVTSVMSEPPTFGDIWAKKVDLNSRRFITRCLEEQILRVVEIVDREERTHARRSQTDQASLVPMTEKHNNAGLLAYLGIAYEGPGHLRQGGPRHSNDFVEISEIKIAPTHDELTCRLPPYLPPNVPGAPHHLPESSVDKLLDIQFRLLREEGIAPLRTAIQCVLRDLSALTGKTMLAALIKNRGGRYNGGDDIHNRIMFNVYTNCRPVNIAFHPFRGTTVDINIDSPPGTARSSQTFARVKFWEGRGGKRLMQGSLVALIQRNTAYLGVITSSLKELSASCKDHADRVKIQMSFFDPGIELRILQGLRSRSASDDAVSSFLIESPVMFETVRPFLEALTAEPANFPFSQYLVHQSDTLANAAIKPPKYSASPHFGLDIRCLFKESPPANLTLQVGNPTSIETCREQLRLPNSRLDPSQADAVVDALLHEVALIQGPPGTGKTYVGVELLRTFMENRVRPILMIAFTNHALDHMLGAVLDSNITRQILRLGSRSSDSRVSEFSMENLELSQKESRLDRTLSSQFRVLKETQKCMEELMAKIKREDVDAWKLENYLTQVFPEHSESLSQPPPWIQQHYEEWLLSDWEVVGMSQSDKCYFKFWEQGGDLPVLSGTGNETAQGLLSSEVEVIQRNKYHVLSKNEESSDIISDDEDNLRDGTELPDLGSAGSWMKTWTMDQPSSQVKASLSKHELDQPRTSAPDNVQLSRISAQHGRSNEIPTSTRPLDDLLTQKVGMWEMSKAERSTLGRHWKELFRTFLRSTQAEEFSSLRKKYEDARQRYNEIKDQRKLGFLKNIDIVGCTTTGAAKFNSLLKSFSPKVLLVEEAGQVLEAHVLGSLVASIEHLILIGDPFQLRPNLANYDLSMDSQRGKALYRFDMSLMERLSSNGLFMSQLEVQRRMRPSISELVRKTLYPKLKDHVLTQDYPHVKGMSKDVFFMSHGHRESGGGEDSVSKHNRFEVDMAVGLVLYLLRQGCYSEDGDIVILCAYLGQLVRMRDALAGKVVTLIGERDQDLLATLDGSEDDEMITAPVEQVAVNRKVLLRTVDNFQGEEAKIIILSLVRNSGSDEELNDAIFSARGPSIGFLKSNNRTNVALSRAKHGLYIMGDAQSLSQRSRMWKEVLELLDGQGSLGTGFPIVCSKHSEERHEITDPKMLAQVAPDGGCLRPCGEILECGHACPYKCHSDDQNHVSVPCNQRCLRHCSQGHPCGKLCSKPCGDCQHPIPNISLPCGHVKLSVPCYLMDRLQEVVCEEMVEKQFLTCEHSTTVRCGKDISTEKCSQPCGMHLLCCGRSCEYPCGKCQALNNSNTTNNTIQRLSHGPHPCRRTLMCGHPCQDSCSEVHKCTTRCHKPCQRCCEHSKCNKPCYTVCAPCAEPCSWSCPHVGCCPMPCGSICSRLPCDERCSKTLKCGHQCPSLCGEPCSICIVCIPEEKKEDVVDFVLFTTLGQIIPDGTLDSLIITLDCKHTFTVATLDGICDLERVYKRGIDCRWSTVTNPSLEPGFKKAPVCPTCRALIRTPRYGRVLKRSALDSAELNVAADMVNSLYKIRELTEKFDEVQAQAVMDRIALSHSLSDDDKKKVFKRQVQELQRCQKEKRPLPRESLGLGKKKNVHMVEAAFCEAWKTTMRPLLSAYEIAVNTASQRPAHVWAYQNAFSMIYHSELDALTVRSDGCPRNPDENAMRIAQLKVGRPPPLADKRFSVEALWVSVKIRFTLARIAETTLKTLKDKTNCQRSAIFTLGSFIRFIYLSCEQDVKLALNTATESESHKQIVTSHLLQMRAEFERFQFDVYMWDQQPHDTEERNNLLSETETATERTKSMIKAIKNNYLSRNNRSEDSRWINENFISPINKILARWDYLKMSIQNDTFYASVSLDEVTQVIRAFSAEFTHAGHWYTCPNGHIYAIGECGGAMQQAVCPECGAPIGGTGHQLEAGNAFAREFEEVARSQGAQPSPWAWGRHMQQ